MMSGNGETSYSIADTVFKYYVYFYIRNHTVSLENVNLEC